MFDQPYGENFLNRKLHTFLKNPKRTHEAKER
jgi:hypothetical protein